MPKCSFCDRQYEFPKGLTVVTVEGKISYFCSSKCRKNSELGRDKKFVKWIIKRKESVREKRKEILEAEAEKVEAAVEKKLEKEEVKEEKVEEKEAEKKEEKTVKEKK